jgi:hypothetical protein
MILLTLVRQETNDLQAYYTVFGYIHIKISHNILKLKHREPLCKAER